MVASPLVAMLARAAGRRFWRAAAAARASAVSVNTKHRLLSTGSEPPILVDASGVPVGGNSGNKSSRGKLVTDFSVDRSGLLGLAKTTAPVGPPVEKEELTPLGAELKELISLKGPITIAEYMMQCANHSVHGYYHSKNKDKIGQKGDFVTSPEISQVFGECVGVWCVSVWRILGCPSDFTLVELGAGNGTLLNDVLKVAASVTDFHKALKRVAVVERSQDLREVQCRALKGSEKKNKDGVLVSALTFQKDVARRVQWYNLIDELPDHAPIILIAQEFLDAFPVHQLVRNKDGVWSEKIVALADVDSSLHFRTMLAPVVTPAVKVFEGDAFQDVLGHRHALGVESSKPQAPDNTSDETAFETLTITDVTDTHGSVEAVTRRQLNDLMRGREAYLSPEQRWMVPALKEVSATEVELCPAGLACVQAVSRKIAGGKCTGAALFIDYGENYTQADTLRGYRNHKQTDFLSAPGMTDVTADVDFYAAARAALQGDLKNHVSVVGPMTQASFLVHMGAVERVEQLIDMEGTSEEKAEEIYNAFEYLVDRAHMGEKFKVLALISNSPCVISPPAPTTPAADDEKLPSDISEINISSPNSTCAGS